MNRLTRDGTAKPVLRAHGREQGQGKNIFPVQLEHKEDYWQSYPVDPYNNNILLFNCK